MHPSSYRCRLSLPQTHTCAWRSQASFSLSRRLLWGFMSPSPAHPTAAVALHADSRSARHDSLGNDLLGPQHLAAKPSRSHLPGLRSEKGVHRAREATCRAMKLPVLSKLAQASWKEK